MTVEIFDPVVSVALACFAHPDDAEVLCGGTIARLAAHGTRVVLVVATRGDKGLASVSDAEERRTSELLEAAAVLAIADVVQLRYGDGDLTNDLELRRRLVTVLRSFAPQLVLGPDPTTVFYGGRLYNHRDHRELGWALLDAALPAASQPGYFPEAGEPIGPVEVLLAGSEEPNTAVDISAYLERKVDAVRQHRSRLSAAEGLLADAVVGRAVDAARSVGIAGAAELFRRVEGAG